MTSPLYIAILTMGDSPYSGMSPGQRHVIETSEGVSLFEVASLAQEAASQLEYLPVEGGEIRATWRIICADTGRDMTQRAIIETVQTMRRCDPQHFTADPAPAWWQEHDPTLCAWELDDFEADEDDSETREELRAEFAAREYPREVL